MIEERAKFRGKEIVTLRFDSLAEAAAYGGEGTKRFFAGEITDHWAGGSRKQAQDIVAGAQTADQMELVDSLLRKVDSAFRDRTAPSWEPDVAGAYPIVPEALQGMPECMRSRQHVESDNAPIRIVVNTFVSCHFSAADVARRGAAVAALAIRLAETRPVELVALCDGKSKKDGVDELAFTFPIEVRNASAAYVAAALACSAVKRQLLLGVHSQYDNTQNGVGPTSWKDDEMRALLGLNEGDVYVRRLSTSDASKDPDNDFSDPVKWVNRQLDKQRELA